MLKQKKQTPTMKCSWATQKELDKEKLIDRETKEQVIKRLLHFYRKREWDA